MIPVLIPDYDDFIHNFPFFVIYCSNGVPWISIVFLYLNIEYVKQDNYFMARIHFETVALVNI